MRTTYGLSASFRSDDCQTPATDVKEILSVIIPAYWLEWFARPLEIPQIVDRSTGEPILLITDYYL